MHTRILMTASAAWLAILGLAASFLPQEILSYSGSSPDDGAVLITKLAGALYLGFAFVNWTARGVLIGGIYSRPLAMGNFFHFAVGTVVLVKALMTSVTLPIVIVAIIYGFFALWYGRVLFFAADLSRRPNAGNS